MRTARSKSWYRRLDMNQRLWVAKTLPLDEKKEISKLNEIHDKNIHFEYAVPRRARTHALIAYCDSQL